MVVQKNVCDSSNVNVINEMGKYKVLEHQKDLSVSSGNAVSEYFAAKMNIKKRQVLIELKDNGCVVQAGAMQWMSGDVSMGSGVKGVGNFIGKMVSSGDFFEKIFLSKIKAYYIDSLKNLTYNSSNASV